MEKEKIKKLFEKSIGENHFKEMIITQLYSWELVLERKKLAEKTIERKIKNILDFYVYLDRSRLGDKKKRIRAIDINKLCFEFVCDGMYNNDNIENEGTKSYRENIYFNVMGGMNYIFENYFDNIPEIIKPLTDEQKEVLQEVSKNKFYKCTSFKDEDKESFYDSLQVKIIEELGIKVYFDEGNLPYVLSHELGQLINVEPKHIREKIKKLNEFLECRSLDRPLKHSNFNTLEDTYINSQNKKQVTSRIYKDMLFFYLMDLSAQGNKKNDLLEFKLKYIDAFNYIEKEYNRLLIENAQLKESFYNMYNEVRKRNRDLLVADNNKRAKKKAC